MTSKTSFTLTIPFSPGDRVWCLAHFQYNREVECLKCKYTGKLLLADGNPVDCDNCRGLKYVIKHFPMMTRPELRTIEQYKVEKGEIKFSCKEDRGFRNWPTHKPEDFYMTFLEARKAARSFNKTYGWPKEKYERDPDYDESRMYWGYRIPGKGYVKP